MTPEKYAFLRSLKEYDVIRLNKTIRVIRKIEWVDTRGKRGVPKDFPYLRGYFYFTILKCSWTGRGYTLYTSNDLYFKDIELVGKNYKQKDTAFSKKFRESIGSVPILLSCCDVKGIT